MTKAQTKNQTSNNSPNHTTGQQSTVLDHIRELQFRLFSVALIFLLAAAVAYPFFDYIVAVITAPLGDQELVYLTPGGAFGFVIKVCMYIGFIAALPVIIYHTYKFLAPVMPVIKRRQILGYTAASLGLSITGIVFAYLISLPAALYFLTSFSLSNINPMLTIDSYLGFAMAYIIAGALLFQLPLIISIIDNITPLSPQKLMGYQRHVILGSVIVAALISPTPDVVNQLLLAGPIVVMYQLAIAIVAVRHSRRSKQVSEDATESVRSNIAPVKVQPKHILTASAVPQARQAPAVAPATIAQGRPQARTIDQVRRAKPTSQPTRPVRHSGAAAAMPAKTRRPAVSIDGMRATTPSSAQLSSRRPADSNLMRRQLRAVNRPTTRRSVDGFVRQPTYSH